MSTYFKSSKVFSKRSRCSATYEKSNYLIKGQCFYHVENSRQLNHTALKIRVANTIILEIPAILTTKLHSWHPLFSIGVLAIEWDFEKGKAWKYTKFVGKGRG